MGTQSTWGLQSTYHVYYGHPPPLPGETCKHTCKNVCINGKCDTNCTWGCKPMRKREDVDVDPLLVKTKREDDDSLSLKKQKDDNDDDNQYEDMNEQYDRYGNPSCEWNGSIRRMDYHTDHTVH